MNRQYLAAFLVALAAGLPLAALPQYTLPDPVGTCAPADPESHTCLVLYAGTLDEASRVFSPMPEVVIHVGPLSVKTGPRGFATTDWLRNTPAQVTVIPPIGYTAGPDNGGTAEIKASPVTIVSRLYPR